MLSKHEAQMRDLTSDCGVFMTPDTGSGFWGSQDNRGRTVVLRKFFSSVYDASYKSDPGKKSSILLPTAVQC